MKVNVSKKDIDNGIGGDDNKCALALAVKRAFNKGVDTTDVAVDVLIPTDISLS